MYETKEDIILFCLTFDDVYRDEPFHDQNWSVIRHLQNRKVFAWIFDRLDSTWVNVKVTEEERMVNRAIYKSVIPAYHLNKQHWSSIILDGTVPDSEIERMIALSYQLTKSKLKRKRKANREK